MTTEQTLRQRIEQRVRRSKRDVFLRKDFEGLGADYRQLSRALRDLVEEQRLAKIGHGIYARTAPSALDGRMEPVKSLPQLGREALRRLGVRTAPTKAEMELAAGQSTQVPTGRVVGVAKRVRRHIGWNGVELRYERV